MRAGALLLALGLALGGCQSELTGVAAGIGEGMRAPTRPLPDPSMATFAFAPFEGVPGNLADNLTRRLWRRAEREGLTVVKRPGGRALFTVDGTLTAVSHQNSSLVFFVFDVYDVAGTRLHRISGQQSSAPAEGDPWSAVRDEDLDLIATRVSALLAAWLNADA